jgi:hypothetical protein
MQNALTKCERVLHPAQLVERVMGIGPTQPAWEAGILPLNYTRKRVAIISHSGEKINILFDDFFHIFSKERALLRALCKQLI